MHRETPVSQLNGVGKSMEARLARLGIATAADLLHHVPFRYEDFSRIVSVRDAREGETVTVKGTVALIANKRSVRKRKIITEAIVEDDSGRLSVVWFGQPFITKNLKNGDAVYLSGVVKSGMLGPQMVSPAYEKAKKETAHTARIVPIYSVTSGLTQKQMRFFVQQALACTDELEEWLPPSIRKEADVVGLPDAVRDIHFPPDHDGCSRALRRLKFDELFLVQLRAQMLRRTRQQSHAPALVFHEEKIKTFVQSLPFALTHAQKAAAWEILQDMQKDEPMNRLLTGDVGSGKTVVAALAAYNAVLNDCQVAIMAPTDILAKQHYASFVSLLEPFGVSVGLFTRTTVQKNDAEAIKKKAFLEDVQNGEVSVVVGTHALLTEHVRFARLGLVIIDEQHRFGVAQRKALREKAGSEGGAVHFVSMTATPIPRSYALAMYGDVDFSMIREKPAGRKEVKTRLVAPHQREKAYAFVREEVKKGRQVFVICPLIGEAGDEHAPPLLSNEKKSVLQEYKKLSEHIFPDLLVGFVHGKMKAQEKDAVMQQFADGVLDILVSTSVVEVGVNIPNASVMMIEGAERFGLAQLHQFRGRVGRAEHQSYCLLFAEDPGADASERLEFFEAHTDGFLVAEYDLQRRGPGEVYGTVQSGQMAFRLATMQDTELIALAQRIAKAVSFEDFGSLKARVAAWERSVHLE